MTALHPLVISLLTAALLLLARKNLTLTRWLSLAGATAHLGVSIALFVSLSGLLHVGNWPAPFGISLIADYFSTSMVLVGSILCWCTLVFAIADSSQDTERFGFHALVHCLMMGVCGAFLTHDLFNLFVWFEVMLMASFVLLSLGQSKQQLIGALRYFSLNLISSLLFLTALGLIYGLVGSLQMSDIARSLRNPIGLQHGIAVLLFVAFGIKAAIVPFLTWLPASYPQPNPAISALFAGLLTKVGVVAILRMISLMSPTAEVQDFLIWAGILSMIVGVLCAVGQTTIRRILSFHVVSQVGYMVLAIGLFHPYGIAACVFYLMHHMLVKANLFLIGGLILRVQGSEDLAQTGGLATLKPWLGALFWIPALSLAGLPPLSGFWAKLMVIQSGIARGHWVAVFVCLGVGLLTLFSMLKIWSEVFWKAPPDPLPTPISKTKFFAMASPCVLLALLTIGLGIFAGWGLQRARLAETDLVAPPWRAAP